MLLLPERKEFHMQAQDVMVRGVISVGPDIPVRVAAHAMVSNRVSAVLVMDIDAKLVGIVSEGDLIRRVETDTERQRSWWLEMFMSTDALAREFVKSHAKRVSDVMTHEVITAAPETPLREIANLMEKHAIKRVPIVQDGLVVGIVSRANLLQALASANDDTEWFESDRVLRQRFIDSIKDMPWASRPFNIIVNDRRADLWGFVFSKDEKAAVRVAAEATAGIESVDDHLRVMPNIPNI
jgi:CBS domain-containing protein